MKRASALLPDSLPPIGISREQAAAFVGVGASLFDRMVATGKMPEPRIMDGRIIWDVEEVAAAFRALPHRSEPVMPLDGRRQGVNPWN